MRSLNELRGKYVLLDFWFIGCGPCERALPNLRRVQEQFRDENFTVVGVHIAGQKIETVQHFAEANEITYPMVIDAADEPILNAYRPLGVQGFPTYILVDPDGNIDTKASLHGTFLECIREKMLLSKSKQSSR